MKLVDAKHYPNINSHTAQALGFRFSIERCRRNLKVEDIADRLLLSKQQIDGLETGEASSFYSAGLFAQAADKYAALLELEEKPSLTLFEQPDIDAATNSTARESETLKSKSGNETRNYADSRRHLVFAALLITGCFIVLWHLFRADLSTLALSW